MSRRLKRLVIFVIFVLLSYGIYNVIYKLYVLPVFKLEENVEVVTINGTEYVLHRLSYNGTTYISEPLADADKYQLGKQVGRTKDGMQIYQVKGDDTRLIMQGFMFPPEVYKKIDSGNRQLKINQKKKDH
ncbi:hypothetical protein [Parageobacillus toebii]|jgi:hypothetical protein|uniref:hypothetical protein n=1 Tax=Parageobacillus toebii TaxID=153151 RepID=UPI0035B50D33